MYVFHDNCKEWQGYKPCINQKKGATFSCNGCKFYKPIRRNILMIEAGGLGSALRASVVTKEIKNHNPDSRIQWLTNERVVELVNNNFSSVDRVYPTTWESLIVLGMQSYSQIINFESNPIYLSFVSNFDTEKKGFVANKLGNLSSASNSATEFLRLQTDDFFRRRKNKKSMQQILLEVSGMKWKKQSYDLARNQDDDKWARLFLKARGISETEMTIGLNIGSSLKHSAKRWPPQYFYELAKICQKHRSELKLLVLAGQDDIDAYEVIARLNSVSPLNNLIFTGYNNTLSQFVSLINHIPIVISADTFGLHVALGLGKRTISLWGPQPEHETYSYEREIKISLGLTCAPCFSGNANGCSNPNTLQCMKEISVQRVFHCLCNELKKLKM